jgi:hypothetical protein
MISARRPAGATTFDEIANATRRTMKNRVLAAAAGVLLASQVAPAAALESTSGTTSYHRAIVDGIGVFYR